MPSRKGKAEHTLGSFPPPQRIHEAASWRLTYLPPEQSLMALSISFTVSTMPTDDTVNASAPAAQAQQENPEIADDTIKSHPLFQDLEKKHAAARKGLDEKAKEVKRLKTLISEDEPEEQNRKVSAAKGLTDDEKELLKWEIKNESKIELCKDEFGDYVSQGYKPEHALRLALQDKGISESNISETLRQVSSGQPAASVNRDPASNVTEAERQAMKEFEYSEEILQEHKRLKALRGKA